jgi:uncharacterized protein (DUF1810 family)
MDLQRFLDAQDAPAGGGTIYEQALAELTAGAKRTHWMWFVFPQLSGLGHSAMAQRYAITDVAEAKAYLAHQVLGPRLRACVGAVNGVTGRSAHQIMGSPDDLKLRSSLTLFAEAGGGADFARALDRYYDGQSDPMTLELLRRA